MPQRAASKPFQLGSLLGQMQISIFFQLLTLARPIEFFYIALLVTAVF